MRASERAHDEDTSPTKIDVTSKSPVGDILVVTLVRTDTTLDHSQKAESAQFPVTGLSSCAFRSFRTMCDTTHCNVVQLASPF